MASNRISARKIAAIAAVLIMTGCDAKGGAENAAPSSGNATPDFVSAAVADPARAQQSTDDAKRFPAQIMSFVGVKPGDEVFELIPGEGYWTRLFSRIVGPQGRVYAVWPQQYARYSVAKVDALKAMAGKPPYENVSVDIQPTPALTAKGLVDVVFTSQNYHDYPAEFMGNNEPSMLNKAAFAMLKPGGTYIVIDHAAAPGTPLSATRELHRIDPALVRRQVEADGFEFVGETDVLARTGDDYSVKVFDPKVRGKTDKFALKFRKPGA